MPPGGFTDVRQSCEFAGQNPRFTPLESGAVLAALGAHLDGIKPARPVLAQPVQPIGECMRRRVLKLHRVVLRHLAPAALALLLAFLLAFSIGTGAALAQSGAPAPQDQQGKAAQDSKAAEAVKDNERKAAEFVDAQQAINGPAGNPECVWLGRRVVRLMWLDDLDTAFRHLDLYDRFGCPGGHVQASFRCLTRFGAQIDDKVPRSLNDRIHACWINPGAQPQAAAAPSATPAPASTTAGSASPAPAASPPPAAAAPAK